MTKPKDNFTVGGASEGDDNGNNDGDEDGHSEGVDVDGTTVT